MQMSGKVCLVTGATSGIGEVTARELVLAGATVIILGRDAGKVERTAAGLDALGKEKVQTLVADFSSQAAVRAAAAEVKRRFGKLQVLVNNAGAWNSERILTPDGLETTFAVNHLAYFLFTLELQSLLEASAPARVVNVASAAADLGKIQFDNLQGERSWSGFGAYCNSKLANLLFTFELARRLEGRGVTVNAAHPGAVASGFGLNTKPILRLGMKLIRPLLLTPEKGARTQLYLATSPAVEGVTGRFFAKSRERRAPRAARDVELARKLWEKSEELTRSAPAPTI